MPDLPPEDMIDPQRNTEHGDDTLRWALFTVMIVSGLLIILMGTAAPVATGRDWRHTS